MTCLNDWGGAQYEINRQRQYHGTPHGGAGSFLFLILAVLLYMYLSGHGYIDF